MLDSHFLEIREFLQICSNSEIEYTEVYSASEKALKCQSITKVILAFLGNFQDLINKIKKVNTSHAKKKTKAIIIQIIYVIYDLCLQGKGKINPLCRVQAADDMCLLRHIVFQSVIVIDGDLF